MPICGADEHERETYADDDELGLNSGSHAVQWVGTPGVKGPPWAKLPLLTVGVLGTQVVWSIEMGYGEYSPSSCPTPDPVLSLASGSCSSRL